MHAAARGPEALTEPATPAGWSQEIVLAVDPASGAITYASAQAESLVAEALRGPAPACVDDWPDRPGRDALARAVSAGEAPAQGPMPGWSVSAVRPCGPLALLSLARADARDDAAFRALVDDACFGVVIHHRFRPLYANAAFARLFGFDSPEAVLGADIFPLTSRATRQTREEAWADIRSSQEAERRWRRRARHTDGSPVIIDTSYSPIVWDGVPAVFATVVDASERQIAEEEMARRERQLLEGLEAISDGFALWDADDRLIAGNSKLNHVTSNAHRVFKPGISFLEAMMRLLEEGDLVVPDGESKDEFVAKRTALHRAHRQDREIHTVEGDWYLVSERATSEGGIVGVYTDITQLKAAQADLAAERARAEAANVAKSQFLAMMSHELRTPMVGIQGVVDLLRTTALTSEQTGFLAQLETSSGTLLTLLNDILDYSKIEAGRLELERVPFSIRRTLEDVCNLFDHAASSGGNCLTHRIDPALPDGALGDPGRIRQVLMNLVGNAVKFTEHGRIAISASCDDMVGEGNAGDGRFMLSVEVADTGIGIAADQIVRLFTAFTQTDASTTRRFGGTGLGLAICRNLVEAMGGDIGVSSTPGHGSAFRFRIPLEACAHVAAEPVARPRTLPGRDFDGIRLLLAEDNELNRSLLTAMLTKMGFAVDSAANGALAVEAVATAAPAYDLVLMDMQMPVMDGPAAAKAIRALGGRHATMPILALTADAMPEHRERYLAAGLDGILTKPVAWDAFCTAACEVLGRQGESGTARPVPQPTPPNDPHADLPALDREAIGSLEQVLTSGVVIELLEKMAEAAPGAISGIRAARSAHDLPALRRRAHELRGMAGNLGAARLAGIASDLQQEDLARDRIDPLVDALAPALDATLAALAALREEAVASV